MFWRALLLVSINQDGGRFVAGPMSSASQTSFDTVVVAC